MQTRVWGKEFAQPPLSFWMASVSFPDFEQLNENLDVDVAVVGGGIVGITSAFLLKQSGLKVLSWRQAGSFTALPDIPQPK